MRNRGKIISYTLLILAVGFCVSLFFYGLYDTVSLRKENERKLDDLVEYYPIIRGEIKSPAVIIELDTLNEFFNKFRELNASTIYLDFVFSINIDVGGYSPILYVFDEEYQIAWRVYLDPIPYESKYFEG